jgi:hypothetical protein
MLHKLTFWSDAFSCNALLNINKFILKTLVFGNAKPGLNLCFAIATFCKHLRIVIK